MNIKEKLLYIEEEFNLFKTKIERKYIYFLFLYFSPPLLAFFIISQYNTDLSENMTFKIIIFGIMLLGLFFHFLLRNTYYKSNEKYKRFITGKLDEIKLHFNENEDFKKAVIESAKEIFTLKNKVLSNVLIKKDIFWYNVFIIIGLEVEM